MLDSNHIPSLSKIPKFEHHSIASGGYHSVRSLTVLVCGCVVWTFVGSSSWSYSRYIWWMCCLNFCRVQFLVLLPLYLVNVLSEPLFTCFVLDFAMERKLKQWWSTISLISTIQTITVCLYSYCFCLYTDWVFCLKISSKIGNSACE
jgi:hypothetical protein